jgi:hypothetical protein
MTAPRTLLVLTVLALNIFGPPTARGDIIDTKTYPINGHIYHLLAPSTWMDAEAEAVSLGGHLMTVNDAAEDTWIGEMFLGSTTYNQFWIGLNDVQEEGIWRWTSGEPVSYVNWQPREPNNAGGLEDFASKEYCCGHTGDWNDANASKYWVHGVVEIAVLRGDFNSDATVDAADYVAWRKGLAIGEYGAGDYNTWRANFGAPAARAAAGAHSSRQSAIPEPTGLALAALALVPLLFRRKRKNSGRG